MKTKIETKLTYCIDFDQEEYDCLNSVLKFANDNKNELEDFLDTIYYTEEEIDLVISFVNFWFFDNNK